MNSLQQNLFSPLPKETLYHCITGSSNHLDPEALKIFIWSGVRFTCRDLYKKTNQICQAIFLYKMADFPETHNASINFICRWLLGRPKISNQTLSGMLKNSFSINDESKPHLIEHAIPWHWTPLQEQTYVAFSRLDHLGDATILNVKTGKLVGKILGKTEKKQLEYDHLVKPLFYKNGVFILFRERVAQYNLHYYEINETGLSLQLKEALPQMHIISMCLLHNHIIFHTHEGLAAISVDKLISSKDLSFTYSRYTWDGIFPIKVFQNKIYIFQDTPGNYICVRPDVKNGKPEFIVKKLEGIHVNHDLLREMTPRFCQNNHYSFSITFHHNDYTIHAISKKDFTSQESPIRLMSYPQTGPVELFQFKNTVILCSVKKGEPLQLQTLDVIEDELTLTPLPIKNASDYKFNCLISIYPHLDKLFILGSMTVFSRCLIIVNMENHCIENIYPLVLEVQPQITALSPGSLHILNSGRHTITEVKYS